MSSGRCFSTGLRVGPIELPSHESWHLSLLARRSPMSLRFVYPVDPVMVRDDSISRIFYLFSRRVSSLLLLTLVWILLACFVLGLWGLSRVVIEGFPFLARVSVCLVVILRVAIFIYNNTHKTNEERSGQQPHASPTFQTLERKHTVGSPSPVGAPTISINGRREEKSVISLYDEFSST